MKSEWINFDDLFDIISRGKLKVRQGIMLFHNLITQNDEIFKRNKYIFCESYRLYRTQIQNDVAIFNV